MSSLDNVNSASNPQSQGRLAPVARSHSEDDRHQFKRALKKKMEEEQDGDKSEKDRSDAVILSERNKGEDDKPRSEQTVEPAESNTKDQSGDDDDTAPPEHVDLKA
ncbi:MAG: hypothetical protein ACE5FH_04285 [Candidatus Zixiibacteriota bacterium]